ncbi:hypothetical protein PMAYCL1PPCAC_25505, partial [Pristionchus mayeri]
MLKDGNSICVINNTIAMEFSINIASSEGGQELMPIELSNFRSPIDHNNVTLIIRDKKLPVSKDYLAVHSPV